MKPQCNECNALHHTLLHRNEQQIASTTFVPESSNAVTRSTNRTKANIGAGDSKPNKKSTLGVMDPSGLAKDQNGLMKLTAVRNASNGQLNDFVSHDAAIDTGATRLAVFSRIGRKVVWYF